VTRALRNAAIFVVVLGALSGALLAGQRMVFGGDVVISSARSGSGPALDPIAAPARSTVVSRGTTGRRSDVPLIDAAWATRTAQAAGVPQPAVVAYARASLMVPSSCGLGWTTLAGIGWVESQHGTIDGRTLGADGRSSSPILGPALDGVGDVAAIRATPGSTSWHGDAQWDHAIGPLQFIPSTWRTWASDGDGDGRRDPHDLDDAAYAAARYLCAGGQDLSTGPGWTAAVFSYNHAQAYVDAVHTAAAAYAERTA
jgi:membrane-bound lytic murein transglycosylase B